jgi:hypothetical protein
VQGLVEVTAAGRIDGDQLDVPGVTPSGAGARAIDGPAAAGLEPGEHLGRRLLGLGHRLGRMVARDLLLLTDEGQSGHDLGIVDRQLQGDSGHGAGR